MKLNKTLTPNVEYLLKKVFEDNTISRTRIFDWHRMSKEERKDVGVNKRPGPSKPVVNEKKNINWVNKIV